MLIYFDSVIVIYLFDRTGLFQQRAMKYNFKLADSLHLAAAIENGCDLLLTNDTRLSRCTDIAVEVLP